MFLLVHVVHVNSDTTDAQGRRGLAQHKTATKCLYRTRTQTRQQKKQWMDTRNTSIAGSLRRGKACTSPTADSGEAVPPVPPNTACTATIDTRNNTCGFKEPRTDSRSRNHEAQHARVQTLEEKEKLSETTLHARPAGLVKTSPRPAQHAKITPKR